MAEQVLVTGGGGFLGRHIVKLLVEAGDSVHVLGRHRYPSVEALGATCHVGSVADREAVQAACEGADVVYHVAALAGVWGDPKAYEATNVQGTENVIAACRDHGIQRLVFTSSPSVIASPTGEDHAGSDESLPYPDTYLADYPRTKAAAEKIVLAANGETLRTTALRPHLIIGPGDPHLLPRVIGKARLGKLRIVGDGTNEVDLTPVEDAARAHVLAAQALSGREPKAAGKAYFITGGEPVAVWPWINEVLTRLGIEPVTKTISFQGASRFGGALEWGWRLLHLGGEPPMTRFAANQLATTHWFDISAAQRDLGYEPQVGMAAATEAVVAHWAAELGVEPRPLATAQDASG
jgi:nucleoside-diphosphate-sugar epimerase